MCIRDRMEGLQRITESDEQQISSLAEEKAALDQQKSEQQRLEQDAIDQRAALEEEKQQAEELRESSEQMITMYQQQEAELQSQDVYKRQVLDHAQKRMPRSTWYYFFKR